MSFRRLRHIVAVWTCCVSVAVGQDAMHDELVWPPPPDPARIRFLYSVASDADVEGEPSWLEKIWSIIIGSEAEHHALVQPVHAAVDADGRLYVTDPGARCVHVFDRKEEEYDRITETGNGPLVSPVCAATARDGRIFVSDSELRRIIVYDESGDAEMEIAGPFSRPTGLSIQGDTLYVVDTGAHAVLAFTLSGRYLFRFGQRGAASGRFNFPVFCVARENLYVVDAMNFRVQVFSREGSYLRSIGRHGTTLGEFSSPKGIAIDSDGHLYVADALFDAIQIFNDAGETLLLVGGSGSRHGEFLSPSGLAFDQDDRLYVVDALNRRVEVFQYLKGRE